MYNSHLTLFKQNKEKQINLKKKMGISPEDLEKITKDIFKSIDLDGNGEIDNNELMQAIEKISQKIKIDVPNEQEV